MGDSDSQSFPQLGLLSNYSMEELFPAARGCVLCSRAWGTPALAEGLSRNPVFCGGIILQPTCLCHLVSLFIFNGIIWIKKCAFLIVFWRQIIVSLLRSLSPCRAQMNSHLSIFLFKKQPCWVFPVVQSVTSHCCTASTALCCLNRCGSSLVPVVSLIVKLLWICSELKLAIPRRKTLLLVIRIRIIGW